MLLLSSFPLRPAGPSARQARPGNGKNLLQEPAKNHWATSPYLSISGALVDYIIFLWQKRFLRRVDRKDRSCNRVETAQLILLSRTAVQRPQLHFAIRSVGGLLSDPPTESSSIIPQFFTCSDLTAPRAATTRRGRKSCEPIWKEYLVLSLILYMGALMTFFFKHSLRQKVKTKSVSCPHCYQYVTFACLFSCAGGAGGIGGFPFVGGRDNRKSGEQRKTPTGSTGKESKQMQKKINDAMTQAGKGTQERNRSNGRLGEIKHTGNMLRKMFQTHDTGKRFKVVCIYFFSAPEAAAEFLGAPLSVQTKYVSLEAAVYKNQLRNARPKPVSMKVCPGFASPGQGLAAHLLRCFGWLLLVPSVKGSAMPSQCCCNAPP